MDDLKERLEHASSYAGTSDVGFDDLAQRRGRRARRRRAGTAAVALGLAAASFAGIASLAGNRGSGDPADGSDPSNSGTSPRMAPFQASALSLEPGQYYYQRVVTILPAGRVEEETWWGLDGSGRRRIVESDPAHYGLGPAGRFGPGEFEQETDLAGLSSDPAELLEQLVERSGPDGASPQPDTTPDPGDDPMGAELWRAFERLVELPSATPELRAALVQVMAGLDGSVVRTGLSDPVGRPAFLVSAESHGLLLEAYVDPRSYQVLAFVRTDVPEGGSMTTIWFATGIVSTVEEVPTGEGVLVAPPASAS